MPMEGEERAQKLVLLQRLGVVALLLAAAFPRAKHLESSFDRGADGERGAAAALAQLNFERLPDLEDAITAIEIPAGTDRYEGLGDPPWQPLIRYSRSALELDHRLEASSFRFLGIKAAEPDAPVEFAVRVPFLMLHILALFVFWLAIATAMGGQVALLSLAFLAVMPPALAYGSLTGTENFALLFSSLLLGLYARHLQKGERWSLGLLAPASLIAVLGAPETLALVALLPIHALVAKRVRIGVVAALLMWTPLAFIYSDYGSTELSSMINPLPLLEARGDSVFSFLSALLRDASSQFTPIALGLAALGIGLRLSRSLNSRWAARLDALEFPKVTARRIEVALLLVGFGVVGALISPETGGPRLLLLSPAVAFGIALFLQQVTRPIAAMRAGIAPLVVIASLIAMPCLARFGLFENRVRGGATPREVGAEIRALELDPDLLCVIPVSVAQGPALEFYARRTLVPQDYLDRAEAGNYAVERGILPWRLGVLLRVEAETGAETGAEFRLQVAGRMTLRKTSEGWEVWW